ncbi:MAG: hypothetical protein FWH55_13655 [Oscillospiraceae bacterium]|nr:hypothetical protein [Oscillospiraceae bacterium]
MENNQAQCKIRNHWKIAAIILIVVTPVLAGTTVFFAVKSQNAKFNVSTTEKESNESNSSSNNTKCPDTEMPEINENNFLTIEEWGVKFKIPYGLEDVTYEMRISGGITIVDLYTRLGDDIGIASNSDYTPFMDNALVSIRRLGTNEAISKYWVKGVIVGDYRYDFMHPQALYSNGDKVNEVKETVAFTLLWSAVHTLTAAN